MEDEERAELRERSGSVNQSCVGARREGNISTQVVVEGGRLARGPRENAVTRKQTLPEKFSAPTKKRVLL